MYIENIVLENFRIHSFTQVTPISGLNILFGQNGAGKTSILEAISIASLGKSFVTNFDQNIIKIGHDYYAVELNANDESNIPFYIKVLYQFKRKKEFILSNGTTVQPKNIIGKIPVVVLNPNMKELVFGLPSFRREFMDKIISQYKPNYLENLYNLKRVLKQRNKLLSELKESGTSEFTLLDLWTSELIELNIKIVISRVGFFRDFVPVFEHNYSRVSLGREVSSIVYRPFAIDQNSFDEDLIRNALRNLYLKHRRTEIERGMTLFGPQKDDFDIILNGKVAKEIASQGQIKTILIALKFAEFTFLKEHIGTNPVVLFDDIFSELDLDRSKYVLNHILNENAQTFVTLTSLETFPVFKLPNANLQVFEVEYGKCSKYNVSFN